MMATASNVTKIKTEIHRAEDGNHREREDRRTGRTRVSKRVRIVWIAVVDGTAVEGYDTLKEARTAYPSAVVVRD
jgi:hypothetical protein